MSHTPMAHTHHTPGDMLGTEHVPEGSPGPSITQATYDPQRRHTCWTINNWTPDELDWARSYPTKLKSVRYHCFSQEVGENGTPHLQGYTAWTTTMSLEVFKRKAGGRLHYEPDVQGSAKQNRDYCAGLVEKKGNTRNPTFEEFGELPAQGDRADWRKAVDQVRARLPVVDVIIEQPHLLPTIRALERYATLSRQPPKDRDVRVLYITGPPGCGKTRAIHEAYPDAYWKPEGEWWDGYEGQPVVVLDDYYSDIRYSQALRVLDRYPLRLPVKGGFVPAEFTTVLITSNAELDEQYPSIPPKRREALYRRIYCVITAEDGINAEHITDALQAPPQHPQVRYPKVHHPSDDSEADPPSEAPQPYDRQLRQRH
jgi:hypothetical protein